MITGFYCPAVSERERRLPLYVETIGVTEAERVIYRPNGIDTYQILYTVEGCGEVRLPDKTIVAEKGSLLCLPSGCEHNYYMKGNVWKTAWITFGGKAAKQIFNCQSGVWCVPENLRFMERFNKIKRYAGGDEWANRRSVLLYSLLLDCRDYIGDDRAISSGLKDKIRDGILFIEDNFDSNIELAQIAKSCSMSREHFCRCFKDYMGESPIDYVKKLRIRLAKELLVSKREMKICEIARKSGFQSSSYFSKVFRQEVGLSPNEYRKDNI